jgi:hypothetical protein
MALDINRGCYIRFHPSGNMKVAMYMDNPGVYMDESGNPLDERFARDSGFDVDKDRREKLKLDRLAAYKAKLEADMASEEDTIAGMLTNKGDYDVRHIGGGQYAVFDKDGKKLTKVAMTKADVELLVGAVPTDPNDPATPTAATAPTE